MTLEPVVLISALEHHVFCARQCALIYVEGTWMENRSTIAGTRAHRRVDAPGERKERGRVVIRAMPLYSDRYGLSGRADGVEVHEDGFVVPVEHKAGVRHGRSAEVQLCAQALCLEEMFNRKILFGYVWYGATRRREQIALDNDLRSFTVSVIEEVRSNIVNGTLPGAVDDGRCVECQLEPVCMPRVVMRPKAVASYLEREVFGC